MRERRRRKIAKVSNYTQGKWNRVADPMLRACPEPTSIGGKQFKGPWELRYRDMGILDGVEEWWVRGRERRVEQWPMLGRRSLNVYIQDYNVTADPLLWGPI